MRRVSRPRASYTICVVYPAGVSAAITLPALSRVKRCSPVWLPRSTTLRPAASYSYAVVNCSAAPPTRNASRVTPVGRPLLVVRRGDRQPLGRRGRRLKEVVGAGGVHARGGDGHRHQHPVHPSVVHGPLAHAARQQSRVRGGRGRVDGGDGEGVTPQRVAVVQRQQPSRAHRRRQVALCVVHQRVAGRREAAQRSRATAPPAAARPPARTCSSRSARAGRRRRPAAATAGCRWRDRTPCASRPTSGAVTVAGLSQRSSYV